VTPPRSARDDARSRLIVALDVPDREAALAVSSRLKGKVDWLKVGLELFTAEGPDLIRMLRRQGFRVFLDLKLHDIPNTVAGAVRAAARLEVEMLTLHAAGGRAMLEAACTASGETDPAPLLLAVTALTSLGPGELHSLGIDSTVDEWVARLARMSVEAGIRGLVCSAQEASRIRKGLGPDVRIVTPGIRPRGAGRQDQARTSPPTDAILAGADQLVVGRPILQSADPGLAADKILDEIEAALAALPAPRNPLK
jgi:orotidine-5'-phosphate decarboxylase